MLVNLSSIHNVAVAILLIVPIAIAHILT